MAKGIEAIIEAGFAQMIQSQLISDNFGDVRIGTITGGIIDAEKTKPFVWVGCSPMEHKGPGSHYWTGNAEIRIRTAHLTGKDRDGTTLVELLASVAYALDFGQMSPNGLNSVAWRRLQGDWEFADSSNGVNIPVEIISACG